MGNEMYVQQEIDEFWEAFLARTGRSEETKYVEVFHFELSEKWANELLRLVLIGQKKATASSLYSYEYAKEPLPKVGDLSIVTDWDGVPRCVIEATAITVLPFSEITYEIAKREGEDDTLESWQKGHIKFYKEEGKILGYQFTEEMLVVFEDFEVVYKGEEQ